MKPLLSLLLIPAVLLPAAAQDVSPELRRDISELISLRAADGLRSVGESLGKAFVPQVYREHFRATLLSGTPVEEPEKTDCPMAVARACGILKQFEPRDFDTQHVLKRMEEHLAAPPPVDEEKALKERLEFSEKVADAYRPVLRAREKSKEDEILRGNATREGVVTLDFGVQMETEAGTDDIRSINRGTSETGVAFYTRTTRRMDWSDLPEAIRIQESKLPKARSWTFWIPADAAEKVAAYHRQQETAEADKRAALMKQLMGAERADKVKTSRRKSRIQEEDSDTEETTMLKIKVWKDDPKAPVETLPDVVSDMI